MLGTLFSQSGSSGIREAFALELLPLLKRMEGVSRVAYELLLTSLIEAGSSTATCHRLGTVRTGHLDHLEPSG
jgi:hypothetical protein